tara:strand:- start:234 stop:455 length:222 start_codon:yes stop_codon:yes gene_type:complete
MSSFDLWLIEQLTLANFAIFILAAIPIAWLIARSIERLCNRLNWNSYEKTIAHKYDADFIERIKTGYRKDNPF